MKVEEVMNAPVVVTQKHIKVANLKSMLSRKGINAVPVMQDNGDICGIVSTSNLMACGDGNMLVDELMTEFVHVISPNNRVKDAAKVMAKHNVHHLVVMEDGKVIGMLSSMDLVKVLAES